MTYKRKMTYVNTSSYRCSQKRKSKRKLNSKAKTSFAKEMVLPTFVLVSRIQVVGMDTSSDQSLLRDVRQWSVVLSPVRASSIFGLVRGTGVFATVLLTFVLVSRMKFE
jgi:hypothetical protein